MNQHNNRRASLDNNGTQKLLSRFPTPELSYDYIDYTKASSHSVFMAVPYGRKCFIWFTYVDDQRVCVIVEFTMASKSYKIIEFVQCIFDGDLSYGTLCYGTLTKERGVQYFFMEELLHYKGKSLLRNTNQQKLQLWCYMLQHEISQEIVTKSQLVIGTPVMTSNFDEIASTMHRMTYDIYDIQCRKLQSRMFSNVAIRQRKHSYRNDEKEPELRANFLVKASIECDLYNLYCYHDGNREHFYNTAYIPNYKSSVQMNSLFRRIVENESLDAIEESEDEADFEDVSETKFLQPNKELIMECKFHHKFRKWVPIKTLHNSTRLTPLDEIGSMIRNNTQRQYNYHSHNSYNHDRKQSFPAKRRHGGKRGR